MPHTPPADHTAPDMLFAIGAHATKQCRLCGEVYTRTSQAYHSHAAKHIRAGEATPVATWLYRRWYRMTEIASRRVRIAWEDAVAPVECRLAEFLADNAGGLSETEASTIRTMPLDFELMIGGGAAPVATVTRIA